MSSHHHLRVPPGLDRRHQQKVLEAAKAVVVEVVKVGEAVLVGEAAVADRRGASRCSAVVRRTRAGRHDSLPDHTDHYHGRPAARSLSGPREGKAEAEAGIASAGARQALGAGRSGAQLHASGNGADTAFGASDASEREATCKAAPEAGPEASRATRGAREAKAHLACASR